MQSGAGRQVEAIRAAVGIGQAALEAQQVCSLISVTCVYEIGSIIQTVDGVRIMCAEACEGTRLVFVFACCVVYAT